MCQSPTLLRTECYYHVSISIRGEKVHVGSFKTPEVAAAAFDAAAINVHGPNTTTNLKLNLLAPNMARTKVCRKAARHARNKINQHQGKLFLEKFKALNAAKNSRGNPLARR